MVSRAWRDTFPHRPRRDSEMSSCKLKMTSMGATLHNPLNCSGFLESFGILRGRRLNGWDFYAYHYTQVVLLECCPARAKACSPGGAAPGSRLTPTQSPNGRRQSSSER